VGPAGTELALLASGAVSPASASKPYYLESRLVAARAAPDQESRFRLWREALALAPTDDRARLGMLQAALTAGRDSLALAVAQGAERRQPNYEGAFPYSRGRRYRAWEQVSTPSLLSWVNLSDAERSQLAASLATAAERIEEWTLAQAYLRSAIDLTSGEARAALEKRLEALETEQARRGRNTTRRPVVRDVIDQDQVVGPRIQGGT